MHQQVNEHRVGGDLSIIEWSHMDLNKFYPMALTSTWTVRMMLYPLAVVRSRLQLQKQTTVYRSSWHAFKNIARFEGVRGLYKGFWITLPQIGTSFIYTTVYEKLRHVLQRDLGLSSVGGISSIAGAAASFSTQIIFVPCDVVSQYMMIYNYADKFVAEDRRVLDYLRNNQVSGTLGIRVAKAVYHFDGLAGFYKGFWASSLVYAPSCLIFWPVYYSAQDIFKRAQNNSDRFLLLNQAVSAAIGGAVATTCTNPLECFRIRLQVHRTDYKQTFERLIRNEGLAVFTKGLSPRLISNTIYSCIVMVGYEMVKRFCVLPEYQHAIKW